MEIEREIEFGGSDYALEIKAIFYSYDGYPEKTELEVRIFKVVSEEKYYADYLHFEYIIRTREYTLPSPGEHLDVNLYDLVINELEETCPWGVEMQYKVNYF